MKQQEESKQPQGTGSEFINQQRDLDKAKNEGNEARQNKKTPTSENDDKDVIKTDVSHKKTGGGKQVSPGT